MNPEAHFIQTVYPEGEAPPEPASTLTSTHGPQTLADACQPLVGLTLRNKTSGVVAQVVGWTATPDTKRAKRLKREVARPVLKLLTHKGQQVTVTLAGISARWRIVRLADSAPSV